MTNKEPHRLVAIPESVIPTLDKCVQAGISVQKIADALCIGYGSVYRAVNRQGTYAGVPR